MKVLITGGSSLLAKYLYATKPEDIELTSTWYSHSIDGITDHHMDVANQSNVAYVMGVAKPEVIIHCAALGNVDFAESNYREAKKVLVDGTANILKWADKAHVVHVSSNAVYGGDNPPYGETSNQNPVNNYGRLKKKAEELVIDYKHDRTIIRPFMLYGWNHTSNRSNWGSMTVNKLKAGEPLFLVNDVIWQPTYACDCAKAIWTLLPHTNQSFNVAASERFTLYDFGLKIAEVFGLDQTLLEPVTSSYFPTIAQRPTDTTYDTTNLREFMEIPDIYDSLKRFNREMA